ncbi:MAG: hypothetical protein ACRBN8_44730 [Nannocystales bacterium]
MGCAPDIGVQLPDTEQVYAGPQVRLHSTGESDVCTGTGPSMEAMLSFLGRETELGDLDQPIEVYLLSEEQVAESCGLDIDGVYACAFVEEPNPVVVTSYLPTEHELVHSYLSLKQEKPKRRHAFLEEGFASVYGRDGYHPEPTTSLTDGLSFARSLPLDQYPRAAHFMNFVIDEFGPAATTRMLLASAEARDLDALNSTFVETLGTSTEALVELYEQESTSCSSAGWQRGYDCESPPEEWHFSGTLQLDIGNECGSPTAQGWSSGQVFERFTLEFPEAATVSMRLDSSTGEQHPKVRLTKCGTCDDEFSFEYDLSRGPLFGLQLEPGTYVLRTLYSSGQPEPGVLELRQQ